MPTKSEKDYASQLAVLRGVTEATGGIHEAQRLNILMWGAIAFEYVKKAKGKWEAAIDVQRRTVTYKLSGVKGSARSRPKNLSSLVAALDRSIHFLFGDEWKLVVRENRKLLYEGECLAPNVNDQRIARAAHSASDPAAK
jgi:hypothetical protein